MGVGRLTDVMVLDAPGRRPPLRSPLRRIEWVLDQSIASQSARAKSARVGVGVLFLIFGCLALAIGIRHDDLTLTPLFFILGSVPIFLNRFGRFGRYFVPVFLGLLAYGLVANYVTRFKLGVHFAPQISIERHITPGSALPTVWLQQHLYNGHTGPLEIFSVAAYAGHFFVPLVLGLALAISGRGRDFKLLMFGILSVAVLGSITFLIAPTAPPWLAADDGYITGVHHAVPSLHAAFPVICLLTAINARLPRWVVGALVIDLLSVVFAIVYMGEHYLVDALVGVAFAVLAWLLVRRLLGSEERPTASLSPEPVTPFVR